MGRRHPGDDVGIEARELVHNLVARPARCGKDEVKAGARRLKVLQRPTSEARGIRVEPVTKANPVRVSINREDEPSATETALAANLQRWAGNTREG